MHPITVGLVLYMLVPWFICIHRNIGLILQPLSFEPDIRCWSDLLALYVIIAPIYLMHMIVLVRGVNHEIEIIDLMNLTLQWIIRPAVEAMRRRFIEGRCCWMRTLVVKY